MCKIKLFLYICIWQKDLYETKYPNIYTNNTFNITYEKVRRGNLRFMIYKVKNL